MKTSKKNIVLLKSNPKAIKEWFQKLIYLLSISWRSQAAQLQLTFSD